MDETAPVKVEHWTAKRRVAGRLRESRPGDLDPCSLDEAARDSQRQVFGRGLGRQQEQRSPPLAAEGAGHGPAPRDRDAVGDLASLAHAQELVGGEAVHPDGPFRIHGQAVGHAAGKLGEHPPPGQSAVLLDVKGREPLAQGLGHHQVSAPGKDHRAVGEGQVFAGDAGFALGCHENDTGGARHLSLALS